MMVLRTARVRLARKDLLVRKVRQVIQDLPVRKDLLAHKVPPDLKVPQVPPVRPGPVCRVAAQQARCWPRPLTPISTRIGFDLPSSNPPRSINTQAASYTLQLSDAGGLVEMNVATANNLTVPDNATVALPIGLQTDISPIRRGSDNSGRSRGTLPSCRSEATRRSERGMERPRSTSAPSNEWLLTGNLAA